MFERIFCIVNSLSQYLQGENDIFADSPKFKFAGFTNCKSEKQMSLKIRNLQIVTFAEGVQWSKIFSRQLCGFASCGTSLRIAYL
jgi:hypothetical protein